MKEEKKTIPDLLERFAAYYKDQPAFFYENEEEELITVSAKEFYRDVKRVEAFWRKTFPKKGQKICFLAENSYHYLVHYFGVICADHTIAPLNQTLPPKMIEQFLDRIRPAALVCGEEYLSDYRDNAQGIKLYDLDKTYQSAQNEPVQETERLATLEDTIVLLASSGTSGRSKIVPVRNRMLFAFPDSIFGEKQESQRRVLTVLPLYHVSGIIPTLEEMVRGNVTMISNPKFLMSMLKSYPFDKLIVVPAMMQKVLDRLDKAPRFKEKCRGLKHCLCLGAGMQEELVARIKQNEIEPSTYYGMTETTGTVTHIGPYRDGACGKKAPYCEIRIEDGEVLVRGENVLKGYYDDPEETEKILDDGWIHTGDLGEMDADGYLFIRGRIKNVIILSNGENVSPEELENRLSTNPMIRECLVYGENDTIKVKIYLGEDDLEENRRQVEEFVSEVNLEYPPAQKMKEVVFTETELAKNSMGKIIRQQ